MIDLKVTELTKKGHEFVRVASLKRERNELFESLTGFRGLTLPRIIDALQRKFVDIKMKPDNLEEVNKFLHIVYKTELYYLSIPNLYEVYEAG